MKPKLDIIVSGGLILIAAAAIGFGFIFRSLSGMIIYDTNDPELMLRVTHGLTREQQHFISMSYDQISDFYLLLLVVTNALWLGGLFYLFRSLRRDVHAA
ncbi:MAG: hypothetical protein P4N60_04020 [Verrucomicrobiae bacterium]|nr:hypothetical protein [Verrucomicrobiae bacterium]